MKVIHVLSLLSVLSFAACQKKENAAPVTKTTAKADSVVQVPTPSFIPGTDTFYGKIYEGDGLLPDSTDSFAYIYVYYFSPDSIRFSSNKYQPYNWFIPYCYVGMNESFVINSSDYYSWINPSDNFTRYSFKFVRDNLYYYSAFDDLSSGDTYITYISGKKITGRR